MDPVRFVFGVHFHQPVGNFDHVFEDHLRDVYLPLVERLTAQRFLPFALHVSGPLLEWLEQHAGAYLDTIGRLAADGQVELLLAGFFEPVVAAPTPAAPVLANRLAAPTGQTPLRRDATRPLVTAPAW